MCALNKPQTKYENRGKTRESEAIRGTLDHGVQNQDNHYIGIFNNEDTRKNKRYSKTRQKLSPQANI